VESPSAVAQVKALLQRDAHGECYVRGSFVNYSTDLAIAINQEVVGSTSAPQIAQAFHDIIWDLWNVVSLIARLEWTDELAQKGELSVELWRQFCSLDIEHFHVELRSILDYAAVCIVASAEKPGSV
jgi:hypothetical protein